MKKLLSITITLLICVCSLGLFGCGETEKGNVNVKYYATPSDIVPLILAGNETIGLIPEPAATALQNNAKKQGKTLYRLDLQELYDGTEKAYPQAVLMVKKSVLGSHPNLANTLNQKITESVTFAKTNTASAVTAISNHGTTTLKAPVLSESVIDACKIYWQSASDAKTSVNAYINGIREIDDKKANVVSDDFFYTTSNLTSNKDAYTFIMPDGAPAIAVSKMMSEEDDLGTNKTVSYSVVTSDLISNKVAKGEADLVLAPINLASKLYKAHDANDHYVMVAVVTHGNFYIISTEEITVNDLIDKQVAVPMKGAVPDWTFQMALKKHGIKISVVG